MSKRYRLYIDESGDHTYTSEDNPAKRYLGLTGIIFEQEYYRSFIHPEFEKLKQKHFPHNPDEPLIFHRTELINKKGPFYRLRNIDNETSFNNDFLAFLRASDFTLITVVIDKLTHVLRYGTAAFHPYHYCIITMLERYCGFLNFYNCIGDVLAEVRGKNEDFQLKEAYQRVYESGSQFRNPEFFQGALSSKEIKLKSKSANIAGLQIADLLAHPCKNQVLYEQKKIQSLKPVFGAKIYECIESKYNRHVFDGRVYGYGKMFLG
jgi:hypothetical protein